MFIHCWQHESMKNRPKNCTLKAQQWFQPTSFRLQAEGVVGIDKACHFASSCHAYDMFCLWGNWLSTFSVMKRYRSIIMDRIKALMEGYCSRAARTIHCAQNVKTVRLCTEFNKSINNIFLICHILWHFQDGRHWPWEFHVGQKLKHAPIFLKIVSNCLLVLRIPKMYSLMHLRCLVFKLHKIIGQRSFQICTGGQNLKLLRF